MDARILIVGGDSEIAAATIAHLRSNGRDALATTRRPGRVSANRPLLDLTQPPDDWAIPERIDAACICAAVARLDDCARDPVGTARVNVDGTIALAQRLLRRSIPVLFLSTDKVFDGEQANVPADAPTRPVSEYGRQKAAAEAALVELMRRGEPVAILRLAKIVMPGMDLLRQWLAQLGVGRPVRAFYDMVLAPTPVALVAAAIEQLSTNPPAGIFQLTGPRDVSYSEVAGYLAHALGVNPALVEESSAVAAGLPAGSTARHTTLDSSALRNLFAIAVPDAWAVIDELIETCRSR